MKKTAAFQLIETLMKVDLVAYLKQARAEGTSWDDIAYQIREACNVSVTRETLRNWHADAEAHAAEELSA